MGLEESIAKTLEGEYIALTRLEADREDEGTSIAIYQMKNGKLKSIFSPGAVYSPTACNACNCPSVISPGAYVSPSERAVEELQIRGATTAVTVFYTEDFFGVPYGCVEIDDAVDDEGATENWLEYHSIERDSYEASLFEAAQIRLRQFYAPEARFLED